MNRKALVGLMAAGLVAVAADQIRAAGGNHSTDRSLSVRPHWPAGLTDVIGSAERVHGYYVNWDEWFYYSGDTKAFNAFLAAYAKLPGVEHRLVIEPGVGSAKSPWTKSAGVPCDWELSVTGQKPCEVVLKVWVGGRVKLDEVELPESVTVLASVSASNRILIARHSE